MRQLLLLPLVVLSILSAPVEAATELMLAALARSLGGWTHKGETAAEFKSSDSNYRMYKPTVSPTPGKGVLVSTKLNHIRRFQVDDQCQVDMEFGAAGQLINCEARLKVRKLERQAKAAASQFGAGDVSAKIIEAVIAGLPTRFPPGNGKGTENFPRVIRHCMNLIAANITVNGRKVRGHTSGTSLSGTH